MVTSKSFWQRWLHTVVSGMCGRGNSCSYERNGQWKEKIDYKSQATAERSAGEMAAKFKRGFDAYRCWFCRGWHVGNAHNLTPWKILSIAWVWVIRRKRQGPKARPWEKA